MALEKKLSIRDLKPNMDVEDLFILAAANQGQARNGPFWRLTLQDATGRMEGKLWSPQAQDYPDLAPGQALQVAGRAVTYRDQVELTVDRLRILTEEELKALPLEALLPSSQEKPEDLLAALEDICRVRLQYPPWRKLVGFVLGDPDIRRRFLSAPAAKALHHAYVGGLAEHTLSVVRLCAAISDHYPDLDGEILVVAGVFHDLGKAWELTGGPINDYTDEGRLVGHIQICLEMLAPFLAKSGLDEHLAVHLKHMLLSHHGEYEFGSPKRPKTAEAMALHCIDNMDAKLHQIWSAFAESQGDEPVWSPFQRALDRFLYRPAATPRENGSGNRRKNAERAKDDQCSLPLKA